MRMAVLLARGTRDLHEVESKLRTSRSALDLDHTARARESHVEDDVVDFLWHIVEGRTELERIVICLECIVALHGREI